MKKSPMEFQEIVFARLEALEDVPPAERDLAWEKSHTYVLGQVNALVELREFLGANKKSEVC